MSLVELTILPSLEWRAAILVAALVLDALLGEPDWLWSRIKHPVVVIGAVIDGFENRLNMPEASGFRKRLYGIVTVIALLALFGFVTVAMSIGLTSHPYLMTIQVVPVAFLLATRSLHDHVDAVANALRDSGLEAGRRAVSMIVGRDPEQLDESGVSRAAIESTAENFADGVVAPAFWFLIAGLPGIVLYKVINTADSMIGHKTDRHRAFGWAAARLDDLVNLIPARLSGMLIAGGAALRGLNARNSLAVMWRDAGKHASPNAGWPETAMAGALGIALAGPRKYAEYTSTDPWLNERGRKESTADDIGVAVRIMIMATVLMTALVATLLIVPLR